MKQRRLSTVMMVFVSSSLLLNACSFSVEVLPTTTSVAPVAASASPTATETPIPETPIPASATPTLISIRADTISMLEIVKSFQLQDFVRDLAFTPDGTVLAATGGNTQGFDIRLWELSTGRELGLLEGHSDIVWGLAFSPDGQKLVSVSSDQTAKIWDWRKGELLKTLDFPGQVVSVSFSPNGQTLAVGGVDEVQNQVQRAAVWTYLVDSWEPLMKFPEYLNILAMAYAPDGRRLIGGGTSRNLQVWRTSDGTSIFTLNHAHQVSEVSISPDGSTAATATCEFVSTDECTEGAVWLWDLPSGRLTRKLSDFVDTVGNVAFSADGSTLVAASHNGTLRFYGTSDYEPLFEFTSPGGISALAVSPDGGLLATGNINGEVYLWKIVYRP